MKATQYEYGLLWENQDLASPWFMKQRDGTKRVEHKKDETCGGRPAHWNGPERPEIQQVFRGPATPRPPACYLFLVEAGHIKKLARTNYTNNVWFFKAH